MPAAVRTPIYAPLGLRDSTIDKDSRLYNGFAEKWQEEGEIYVYKRPGMSFNSQPSGGAATGRGVFNWKGNIYAVFNGTLYKDGANVGAVSNVGLYTFSSCLGATPRLFFHNTINAYTYDSGAGVVAVTDVDYPATTVPGSAYLDGTTYVMTPSASIRGDDFNNPQSWDPLNTLLAQIEPDDGVYLAKHLVYTIAFKQISTEVFYDAGNAVGSPLGPVQGSKIGVGVRTAGSVCKLGDNLAWIGTTTEADVQVMFMSKVKADVISTPPVERLLKPLNYTTVWSWSAKANGHRFYVVTFPSSNLTLAFDVTSLSWYIWTDVVGNYMPIIAATYDTNDTPILQHATNGKLYNFSATEFGDEGQPFPWRCFTPRMDGGLRAQKANTKIELVADRTATNVRVSWSDDDYQTFNAGQDISLDQDRVWLQDGSAFSTRAYQLFHSDLTFLRIKGMDLTTTPGTL